jgi:hypothetical protein
MSDIYWLRYPRSLIKDAATYLKKHGYADYNVYELAEASPQEDDLNNPHRNALMPVTEKRRSAEIVAIARLQCFAQEVLCAWEQGNHDMVAEGMYYLGHQEAVAKLLGRDPGHSPEYALDHNKFLSLARWSQKHGEQRVKTQVKTARARAGRADNSKRNNWLISEARKLLGPGRGKKNPREITSILVKGAFRILCQHKFCSLIKS